MPFAVDMETYCAASNPDTTPRSTTTDWKNACIDVFKHCMIQHNRLDAVKICQHEACIFNDQVRATDISSGVARKTLSKLSLQLTLEIGMQEVHQLPEDLAPR